FGRAVQQSRGALGLGTVAYRRSRGGRPSRAAHAVNEQPGPPRDCGQRRPGDSEIGVAADVLDAVSSGVITWLNIMVAWRGAAGQVVVHHVFDQTDGADSRLPERSVVREQRGSISVQVVIVEIERVGFDGSRQAFAEGVRTGQVSHVHFEAAVAV